MTVAGVPQRQLPGIASEPVGRAGARARVLLWITVLVLTVVALVPIAGNEQATQNVDPMFTRNVVERTRAYGGTFYENAIHNKGPFEPLVYAVVRQVSGYDGFWLGISLLVTLIAAVLGCAGALTATSMGGNAAVGLAAAAVMFVHFTLGTPQYARVVYVRNLTVWLLALTWILLLSERAWATPARARRAAVAVGALLGLAVQTLLSTAFAAAVVGLTTAAMVWHRLGRRELARLVPAAAAAGAVSLLSAPVWYALRGRFSEFWAGWWVYASYMSSGTGRSLRSQIGLGAQKLVEYYSERRLLLWLVIGFVVLTWLLWPRLGTTRRILHLGIVGWFLAAWVELVLSQRYSEHYFSVLAVPTALMGCALAGQAWRGIRDLRPATRATALPVTATVLAVAFTSPTNFLEAAARTSEFTSVSALAAKREKGQPGTERSVRALLDLVSAPGSPMLAWTIDPTVYLKYERVSATRFQWKSFLRGEIYLGETSDRFVLPSTWTWFREDLAESRPRAFVETEDFAVGTPFDALVHGQFTEVFEGSAGNVWLRKDVARQVLEGGSDRSWPQVDTGLGPGSGWVVEENRARFQESDVSRSDDLLTLARDSCFRLEGTIAGPASGDLPGELVLHFDNNRDPDDESLFMAIEDGKVGSGSAGLGPLGYEAFDLADDIRSADQAATHFALVVGRRSAALLVEGRVRAALRLPESVRVRVEPKTPLLELADLRVGPAASGSGCPHR